jgi:malate synthase
MNIFTKLASFFNNQKSEFQEPSSESMSLTISNHLRDFLENEVLDGLDISKEHFWSSFEKIINEFSPRNKALLHKREDIQSQIDSWHIDRKDVDFNPEEYKTFL